MNFNIFARLVLSLCITISSTITAFVNVPMFQNSRNALTTFSPSSPILSDKVDPSEYFDPQRQEELFQFLLRDLQIENVPLLSIDATQVQAMQAAIWTIMAEMWTTACSSSEQKTEKSCLIFEEIPLSALRSFVTEFRTVQTDTFIQQHLPDFSRFHLSLVGNGVGPAILIELSSTDNNTGQDNPLVFSDTIAVAKRGPQATAVLQTFVERMILATEMSVDPSRITYRSCQWNDICHVMSFFWNGICELQATPTQQLSAMFFTLPSEGDRLSPERKWQRFMAITQVVSRFLVLYRGDMVYEVLYGHPRYQRNEILPKDQPLFGHLPPLHWVLPIWNYFFSSGSMVSKDSQRNSLMDVDLLNYQRRSPIPCIGISRLASVEQDENKRSDRTLNEMVDLGEGVVILKNEVKPFCEGILRLQEMDVKNSLQQQHEREVAMVEVA